MKYNAFKQLDKIEDVVRQQLKDNIVCRDNTTYLHYLILKDYYRATNDKGKQCDTEAFLSDLYDLLHYAPNAETIQRARRKVQNKYKQYQPKKAVKEQRKKLMDDYSDYGIAD
ncbi:MAG: hypothetical protein CMM25_05240 [Rhodospirillaceae bacterium]|nr:hypothetical protein [Rhodospirillaceae bacterium]|tara:strand:- start:310 stop:648 length:339 start_codon:yes stop_codon:yes gene_type:complete